MTWDSLRSSLPETLLRELYFPRQYARQKSPLQSDPNFSVRFVFCDPTSLPTQTQAELEKELSFFLSLSAKLLIHPRSALVPFILWENILCLCKNYFCFVYILSTLCSEISMLCLDIQNFWSEKHKQMITMKMFLLSRILLSELKALALKTVFENSKLRVWLCFHQLLCLLPSLRCRISLRVRVKGKYLEGNI